MRKQLFILSIPLFLGSCAEEVSKDINTNLTLEADQLFGFSETIGESAYLGNISYTEYSTIASEELPGCPTIAINPDSRIVTLDYSLPEECEQENNIPRTGRIILDFRLSNSESPSWSLLYEGYTYRGIKIEGFRMFEGISMNENRESFENLTVKLEKNLSFRVGGQLSYSFSRYGSKPFSLKTTRGRIEGNNPAGRDFLLLVTATKEQLFQCYSAGWDLPQDGKESWIVSRSATADLEYDVSFQGTDTCNPVVISTLPDGRTLQLNP